MPGRSRRGWGPERLPTPETLAAEAWGGSAPGARPGRDRPDLARPLPPWPPGRASGKPGAAGKPRKIPGWCTPEELPRACDPGPWGPAPLRLAAVIFRKSEIKDGWRSGPERLGRRSAGGKDRGEKAKALRKFFKREILCPSPAPLRALQSPQRVARTPAPGDVERSRPLPPLGPGGARATDRPPPPGGVFQGRAPSAS